jgi:carbamoyl-phosphate synthase large subunit
VTTVLFTCSGQRVDVVHAFRSAGATTIAVDVNPLAPSLYHADVRLTPPRYEDPSYVGFLADAVRSHGVQLIVPLTDLDQLVLAQHRDEIGTLVLLPDPETIELTLDKYLAHRFFLEHGIASPASWLPDELPGELPFPVLVKSRRGFGSRDIYRAHDRAELDFFLRYTRVPSMVQLVCTGEEFSIDVLCDFDGRCLGAIPRTMIESKGGESIKGMSIKDWSLIEVGRNVAETLGIKGPANVQCFRTPEGRHEITDVNARFGGGFPVPLAAGGGYPELALALARGERPEPRLGDFREGVFMTRFFWQVCLEGGAADGMVPLSDALPGAATVGRP